MSQQILIILHFHYVLSMGAVFALISAWYFWIPKILGVIYKFIGGNLHFVIFFFGVNVTFFPQHFLGLQGMPRRISDYPDAFWGWNLVSSLGSLAGVVATWLFLYILYIQLVEGKVISWYPWLTPEHHTDTLQAYLIRGFDSLEWGLDSPPKPHAFTSLPLQSLFPLETVAETLEQTLESIGTSMIAINETLEKLEDKLWDKAFDLAELSKNPGEDATLNEARELINKENFEDIDASETQKYADLNCLDKAKQTHETISQIKDLKDDLKSTRASYETDIERISPENAQIARDVNNAQDAKNEQNAIYQQIGSSDRPDAQN